MNTVFLLMAQYGATAVVPVELVCRDYFSHLTVPQFVRKVSAGDIAIPLVRMERSQKASSIYLSTVQLRETLLRRGHHLVVRIRLKHRCAASIVNGVSVTVSSPEARRRRQEG